MGGEAIPLVYGSQRPDVLEAGALTQAAKDRALEAMNQIRALHNLAPVHYSRRYDNQVQEAALIQAAGSYLRHFPEPSDSCYTPAGSDGSSSNLSGGGGGYSPGVGYDRLDHLPRPPTVAPQPLRNLHELWAGDRPCRAKSLWVR